MHMYSKVTTIDAGKPTAVFWHELWEYRELLTLLVRRDIAIRYKQTVLGVGWAVIRPLLTILVFAAVFSLIVKVPSQNTPYLLLVLAALLPWQLISGAMSAASESLLGNSGMLSKVYFPRLLFPLSAVATAIADFAVAFGLLLILMAWYGVAPSLRIVALVPLLTLSLCLAAGLGIWLSAVNVKFRDFRYVVPFLVQLGMYVSPIGYPTAMVPAQWQLAYALNPAVGIIDGFRWALLDESYLNLPALGISCVAALLAVLGGLVYFRRVERGLVDEL